MNIIAIESECEPDHPSSSTIIVATQTITSEEVIASPRKKRRVIHTGKSKGCHICGKDDKRCFWIGCGYKKKKTGNETCSYWVHQSCVGLFYMKEGLKKVPFFVNFMGRK